MKEGDDTKIKPWTIYIYIYRWYNISSLFFFHAALFLFLHDTGKRSKFVSVVTAYMGDSHDNDGRV